MKNFHFIFKASLLVLLITISSVSFGQDKNPVKKELSLEEKMDGTYEIIRTNTKTLDVFTTELLKVIESKRAENEDVVYVVSPNTSIRIFSRAKINSPGFKR